MRTTTAFHLFLVTVMSAKPTWYSPIASIKGEIDAARKVFNSHALMPLEKRKEAVGQIMKFVNEQDAAFKAAIWTDLHKNEHEFELSETSMVRNDCVDAMENLEEWAAPVAPSVGLVNAMDGCLIVPQPLGVVLIMGAWNYPLQLLIVGAVGALAAGNVVILKPSELAPEVAKLIGEFIPKYFPDGSVRVINGGADECTELLKYKFDKIMYTGSGRVGRIIARAAAEHLTPTILELGGKSPTYVDEDLDPNFLEVTARRIVWGRFSNSGQTCIAPDYVLTKKSMMKPLTQAFQKALLEFFGSDPQKSDSYGRIVSPARFRALNNLLKGQEKRVVIGGQVDEKELYIAPTVLEDVDRTDAVMQEEIFGPILPLVAVESMKDAIDFINNGDKPLALYVFSNDKLVCKHFIENTTSGGAISNDVLMHCTVPELPFGGVGESGMGAYHGKFTFDQFSHQRAVMMKDTSMESVMSLRYPPYTATKLKWLLWVAGKTPSGPLTKLFKGIFKNITSVALVAAIAYIVYSKVAAK